MQEQIQDHITYSDGELPIPTFHCRCGHNTEGFSLCLKCHPQSYTVRQDLVDALHELSQYNYGEARKKSELAKQNNVYAKEVWNLAIEAAAKIADEACERITAGAIRELKK